MKKFNHKTAVVIFNLGGPDKLEAVKPFLFNLFNDKAIISLPQPFRFLLAKFIAFMRHKKSQNIYKQIQGQSPILNITIAQADELERELSFEGDFKVFVSMRYWHPFSKDVIKKIIAYNPQEIILLPLYPQFSSTTSASSIEDFTKKFSNKNIPIKTICCHPNQSDFIKSHLARINQTLMKINSKEMAKIRLLFSAHGLPQKIIDNGDPYVFQVHETVNQIMKSLHVNNPELEYRICYQSKVGPLEWTSPSLNQEMQSVALDNKIPVIIPIAFVSDHSETLVELDIEYLELSKTLNIENYYRVASLNTERNYILSLKNMVIFSTKSHEDSIFCGESPQRICPKKFKLCPNQNHCKNQ